MKLQDKLDRWFLHKAKIQGKAGALLFKCKICVFGGQTRDVRNFR